MSGSGLFTKKKPLVPHLTQGSHGVEGELADLRKDVTDTFASLVAVTVDEYTAPATGGNAALKTATATVAAPVTVLKAALLAGGLTALGAGRNITFTTAGSTASDAPPTALITGLDRNGHAQTETVTLAQTAATAVGVKLFTDITKIDYPSADGTGATVAIGVGSALPISKTPIARGGGAVPLRDILDGASLSTGVLSLANKSFTPATAPDGAHNYAVYYEFDPNV